MSHQGAPPSNIAQHPAIRKLEQKVQSLEKKHHDDEARIAELQSDLNALQTKMATLVRNVADLQRGVPGRPLEAQPQFGSRPVEYLTATPTATPTAAGLSLAKIDAHLSNLGIRLVEVDPSGTECTLEAMNRFGEENLAVLGQRAPVEQVAAFVREREHLA